MQAGLGGKTQEDCREIGDLVQFIFAVVPAPWEKEVAELKQSPPKHFLAALQ